MRQQRNELQKMIAAHFADKESAFNRCFADIDRAISSQDSTEFIAQLNELAITFGVTLELTEFDEFDQFMHDETAVLKF